MKETRQKARDLTNLKELKSDRAKICSNLSESKQFRANLKESS